MLRLLFLVYALLLSLPGIAQQRTAAYLDPTGQYKLRAPMQIIAGKRYGYEGSIAVRLIAGTGSS